MHSDDKWFLYAPGMIIFNDRNQEDFAYVDDILF